MTIRDETNKFISVRDGNIQTAHFDKVQFDLIDRGKIRLPIFLRPCKIKILVLVDNDSSFVSITYGRLYFSLSEFVKTLENDPDWWVEFELTKAHRQSDVLSAADVESFRFDDPSFDINEYDQVWFFGAGRSTSGSGALDDSELEILARWMDEKQGGVFACGDHSTFGASLCSRIPRVRNMRKWTSADGVPSGSGSARHDTLVKGHDSVYTFNDESDDIPMKIRLRRYPLWSALIFHARWMPHPVLCGHNGPIEYFPDHPHEGEVVVPSDTSLNISFNGYTAPEYPGGTGKPEPEIIAWATVQGDHTSTSDLNKGYVDGKEFGAVGAYDGHEADVGRVVVDSTWHHWMDVNLIGRPTGLGEDPIDPVNPTDPKAQGFKYSQAGEDALKEIKNYFLNVAQWLASPAKQRCMFMRASWGIVIRYPLAEAIHPSQPIWLLGDYATNAIGKRATQCTVRTWLKPIMPDLVRRFEFHIDWEERIGPRLAAPGWEAFETIIMGGVTRAMLKVAYDFDGKDGEMKEGPVAEAMAEGIKIGLKEFSTLTEESRKELAVMDEKIDRGSLRHISAKDFYSG